LYNARKTQPWLSIHSCLCCSYPGLKSYTWVGSFTPGYDTIADQKEISLHSLNKQATRYEILYPGMKFCTQVWNCVPRYELVYPVWNFSPR
jgi:hypothetical protein